MSELSTLILTLAIFLGGVVSGSSGFAFSAVSGVILLHFLEPLLAIPLMMCCSIASQNQLFDGHSSVRPMARKRAFAYRRYGRALRDGSSEA
jgi:hypothetical protein